MPTHACPEPQLAAQVPAGAQRPVLCTHDWPVGQSAARHWLVTVTASEMVQSLARAGLALLPRATRTTALTAPSAATLTARYATIGVPSASSASDA